MKSSDEATFDNLDKQLMEELEKDLGKTPPTMPKATIKPMDDFTETYSAKEHDMASLDNPSGDYAHLTRILGLALKQSRDGKGHDRHANSPVGFRPWHEQPILTNARQVGPGGLAQQVMKKAGESVGMAGRFEFEAAKAEALGAIVYAAALYKLYEEMEQAN